MLTLTPERLAANAFRTLGLPATASQEAIDAAARRMRIWADPAMIPPTPWDLPWLGPVPRSRSDLERAVSKLNEPGSRVEERLLWFQSPDAPARYAQRPPDEGAPFVPPPPPAEAAQVAVAAHDAALADLQATLLADPDVTDAARWRRVIEQFGDVARSEVYLSWLMEVERAGDYEKRASAAETADALSGLPGGIAGSLLARAEEALEYEDVDRCAQILRALRGVPVAGPASGRGAAAAAGGWETRILDRVEDVLARRCERLRDEMGERIRCDQEDYARNMPSNEAACRDAANAYNGTIGPLLGQLEALGGGNDPDRMLRAKADAAKTLATLGTGWVWAGNYVVADRTFEVAAGLAEGTALEYSIRADQEENAERADRQRQGGAGARSRSRASSSASGRRAYASSGSSGGRLGWVTAVFFIAMALRMIIVGAGGSGSNSSNYNNRRPYAPPLRSPPSYYTPSPGPGTPAAPGGAVPDPGTQPGRFPGQDPARPGQPGRPGWWEPTDPGRQPGRPSQPERPGQPNQPNHPTGPGRSPQPGGPAGPGGPGPGGRPGPGPAYP